MNIRIYHSCGHASDWPINPPSDVRAEIEACLCEVCWAEQYPEQAADRTAQLAALEAEAARQEAARAHAVLIEIVAQRDVLLAACDRLTLIVDDYQCQECGTFKMLAEAREALACGLAAIAKAEGPSRKE